MTGKRKATSPQPENRSDSSSTKRVKLDTARQAVTGPKANGARPLPLKAKTMTATGTVTGGSTPLLPVSSDTPPVNHTPPAPSQAQHSPSSTTSAAPMEVVDLSLENTNTCNDSAPEELKPKYTRKKLAPGRPWPIVPTSVTASGPRSSHTAGKNYICITRKTKIGAYLRRCKDLVLKDGYKTLHLSALGAAIPLLTILTTSLPSILPYGPDQIAMEYLTGTVQVQDELIPEDENEDVVYETRGKSNLIVVIKIDGGDGEDGDVPEVHKKSRKVSTKRDVNRTLSRGSSKPARAQVPAASSSGGSGGGGGKVKSVKTSASASAAAARQVVFQEPDQDEMET